MNAKAAIKKLQPLKGREAEVLRALSHLRRVYDRMPTEKELCHAIGMTRGSLTRICPRLVRKGYLSRLPTGTMRYLVLFEALPEMPDPE